MALVPLPGTNMIALLAYEAAMTEGRPRHPSPPAPSGHLRLPLDEALLDAPLRPGKIIGVGRNYGRASRRAGKLRRHLPQATSSICGHRHRGARSALTKPDWEAELAVIIGMPAYGGRRPWITSPAHHPWNDISARNSSSTSRWR